MAMTDKFDRWLESQLQDELYAARAIRPIPARARYRASLSSLGARRGVVGALLASAAGKLLIATAAVAVAGTAGAEVTGHGPVKVGPRGPFVQLGITSVPAPARSRA